MGKRIDRAGLKHLRANTNDMCQDDNPSDPTMIYLNSITQDNKGLSKEQEKTATPKELVESNLAYVIKIAMRYKALSGIEPMDLICAGNEGMIRTAKNFKPEKGRFTTYAIWDIRNYIWEEINSQTLCVHMPKKVRLAARKIDLGKATRQELDISKEDAELMINALKSRVSIDEANENPELMKMLDNSQRRKMGIQNACERKETKHIMRDYVELIRNAREKIILKQRFGIGCDRKTLEEIGEEMGFTKEYIRKIEAKAKEHLMEKLIQGMGIQTIRDILDDL